MLSKRILTIMLIVIIMITLGTINSLAAGNIELNITGETTINSGTNIIELTISLGNFTDIEEGEPLGYEGTITYDEDMFESIEVEGLNGWTANYEDSTHTLVGETDTSVANIEIAKVTLTLKDGVEPGTSGKVNFNNILLTDGDNDFTFNKEITVTVENTEEQPTPENPGSGSGSQNVPSEEPTNENSNTNNTNTTTIQGGNTDKTTASASRLPSAGVKNVLIIALVVAIIAMIVFKIKSRDIKY